MDRNKLQARFTTFWREQAFAGNPEDGWREIARHYGDASRAYHTLEHIDALLSAFDELRPALAKEGLRLSEMEAAIWYHDLIYVCAPDSQGRPPEDNEQRSAMIARDRAAGSRLDSGMVYDLILATRHDRKPATREEAFLMDLDLGILGQADRVYDAYEKAIRHEYRFYDWMAYAQGRTRILKAFLARPDIYFVPDFVAKYDARARGNLKRAIVALESPIELDFPSAKSRISPWINRPE